MGQYDPPHSPAIYNDRDKEKAFGCFAYIRAVHSIGVLNSIYTFIKETIEMEKVDRRQNTAGKVYLSVRDVQIEVELLPDGVLITARTATVKDAAARCEIKYDQEKKMLLSGSEKKKEIT